MKREEIKSQYAVKKKGLSDKQFIEYLDERYRKLKLEEQKFREQVLARSRYTTGNSDFAKLN